MKLTGLMKVIALTTLLLSVTACQTTGSNSTFGDKNPNKAVQLRTQLAAEYIRTGDLDRAKKELDQAMKINARSQLDKFI